MSTGRDQSPVEQAKELLAQKEYRAALDLVTPWLADHPDDASAWATLAAAYFQLEDWVPAKEAAAEVVRLRPDSARDWCNLGTVLRKLGELDQAEQAQQHALTVDPSYERTRIELAKLRELRAARKSKEPGPDVLPALEPGPASPSGRKLLPRAAVAAIIVLPLVLLLAVLIIIVPRALTPSNSADEAEAGPEVDTTLTPPDKSATPSPSRASEAMPTEAGQEAKPDEQGRGIAEARKVIRRGRELYEAQEYEAAKKAFIEAQQLGSNDASRWIDSCDARLTEIAQAEARAAQEAYEQTAQGRLEAGLRREGNPIPCTRCNRTGRVPCSTCNGTGYIEITEPVPIGAKTTQGRCPTCHGVGELRCGLCGGVGYHKPDGWGNTAWRVFSQSRPRRNMHLPPEP